MIKEAEIIVRHLRAKEHQGLPVTTRAERESWKRISLSLQAVSSPVPTLTSDFWLQN